MKNDPRRAFLRYYAKIKLIQRNLKLCLQHNWLIYSIINFQWDKYEQKEVRAILSIRYIREQKTSKVKFPVVPVKERLKYMRKYRVQNK
mmetsp:Transcript_41161/g.47388  ORF Transcript_41161/g.47388 Transcript_41161/m.47388 type:complete len:89 (+) Transcript_41161:149-415(+)